MHLKLNRYLLRTLNSDLTNVFSEANINDENFTEKTLFNESLKVYNGEPYQDNTPYASYDSLISTFTKPELIYTRSNKKLFLCNILYAKTKNEQSIVNVETWDETSHLDIFNGPANRLKVYFIFYDNIIKYAVQYQYQSIPNKALYFMLRQIADKTLLSDLEQTGYTIDIFDPDDVELCIDYSPKDFEETFNSSRKRKKLIFSIDTQNEADDIINSGKLEYSLKPYSSFENILQIARVKVGADGLVRYIIKCEDSDGKTASIESLGNDIITNEWQERPRIDIDNNNFDKTLDCLFEFLRY